jgi:hypothetical protein
MQDVKSAAISVTIRVDPWDQSWVGFNDQMPRRILQTPIDHHRNDPQAPPKFTNRVFSLNELRTKFPLWLFIIVKPIGG